MVATQAWGKPLGLKPPPTMVRPSDDTTVAEVARVLRGEAPRNPVNLACYVPRNGQK